MNNYTKEELAVIQKITEDAELIEVGRKAIEDTLVDWRDSRVSVPLRGNGLVIREKDGEGSAIIRMGPEEAIRIGLRAIIKALSKSGSN